MTNMQEGQETLDQIQTQLQESETTLRGIIEGFIELGVSIYDYPGSEEAQLGMVTSLKRNVEKIKSLNTSVDVKPEENALQKIQIPLDVLQYIEEGRNPDVYTREFVEAIQLANKYQIEKQKSMKFLRNSLADKITKEFPDLKDQVDSIVTKTGGL